MITPPLLLTADTGSRALDAEIARALGAEVTRTHGRMGTAMRDCPVWPWIGDRWQSMPRWSHEIDAALQLTRELLKPWAITVEVFEASAVCQIHSPENGETTERILAPTPELAIIRALFAAKEAAQ